ncbi:MAG: AbrB/MazE/SpoVT family DNA-binding domain-containing protein [Actinomycetota bacterium]|nr:AbrB/MazE/SpoVT family DNA-binding domain-containing protein [Actinomycetota bacterium]
MRVTVDRIGRIVIPEQLRMALGIGPGTELEIVPDGAGLRLEPLRRNERPVGDGDDGLPLLGTVDGAVLTGEDVRHLRDDVR